MREVRVRARVGSRGEARSGDETYSAADAMKASMLRFQSARRLW